MDAPAPEDAGSAPGSTREREGVPLAADPARPLRVPPGVPLGTCYPPVMRTGEMGTWRLSLTLGSEIKGERLVLWTGGTRWIKLNLICQNEHPSKEGFVSARVADGPALEPVPRPPPKKIHDLMRVAFRVPEKGLGEGTRLELVLGDTSGGSPGLRGPRFTVQGVFLALTLEPRPPSLDQHEQNWVGAFVLDFVGGDLDNLLVLAPSTVKVDQAFSLLVRPQDRFGCISPQVPSSLTVAAGDLTTEVAVTPDKINFAGAVKIDGVELSSEGVHRILVSCAGEGLEARSNPIAAGWDGERLLWGVIHEHTEISDGTGSLDLCYGNMRHGSRLDFGAAADHDHVFETKDFMWEMTKSAANRHYCPGEFTSLIGYEWAKWRRNGDGDRNVYYPGSDGTFYRSETGQYDSPTKLFAALHDKEALIIPHHTAYTGNFCDWTQHDSLRERLVEIYSVWGSSENGHAEGNPRPIRDPRAYNPVWVAVSGTTPELGEEPVGFVQNALEKGWRVGFTAGGDMHQSHPGDQVLRGFPPYEYAPGLTGLWASDNTREGVWSALWNRSCFATTGARIMARMEINGSPMGSQIALAAGEAREILFEAHGTEEIRSVDLVRNSAVIMHESDINEADVGYCWRDEDDLDGIAIKGADWCDTPFTFYYVRLLQIDGEMAWTSPVWVDSE